MESTPVRPIIETEKTMRAPIRLIKSSSTLFMLGTLAAGLNACAGSMSTESGGFIENFTVPAVQDVTFPPGSTMEKIAKNKKIRVGTKFDQPLMGQKGFDGKPAGFDVNIAKIIAAGLGLSEDNIDWVETVSANREPFIQNGNVDIVVATYTINDKRKQAVDFAGPYYNSGQNLMVLKENATIRGPRDVFGKKVCSVTGSTPAATIIDVYGAVLVPVQKYSDCLEPLLNRQVEAMTTDRIILTSFVAKDEENFKMVPGDNFTVEPYGIGLKKGDAEFRNWINERLRQSLNDGQWEAAWKNSVGKYLPVPEKPTIAG